MGIAQLSFNELRGIMTGDGTALANSVAATSLLTAQGKFNIPANWWAIGKKAKVRAWGRCSWQTTAVSFTPDIRFGATVVFNGGAVLTNTAVGTTAAAQKAWRFEADLTCRAIGAAANLIGSGKFESFMVLGSGATLASGNMIAQLPWNAPPVVGTNFDSTVVQAVDLFGTWGAANADNTIQCHMFDIELVN